MINWQAQKYLKSSCWSKLFFQRHSASIGRRNHLEGDAQVIRLAYSQHQICQNGTARQLYEIAWPVLWGRSICTSVLMQWNTKRWIWSRCLQREKQKLGPFNGVGTQRRRAVVTRMKVQHNKGWQEGMEVAPGGSHSKPLSPNLAIYYWKMILKLKRCGCGFEPWGVMWWRCFIRGAVLMRVAFMVY